MSGHVTGVQDTATTPATGTRILNPAPINFGADYRIISESPSEVILTNLTSPAGAPETVRIAFSDVTDIFKGSKLASTSQTIDSTVDRRGLSLLVQINGSLLNGSDPQTLFPYSANIVLKLPLGCNPDDTTVGEILPRLLGHLYGTKDTTISSRINALVRGALAPVEL
jgi:hypothetical protein